MHLGHLIRDSNKEPLKVSCSLEVSPLSGPPALSLSSVDESEGDLGPPACRVLESSQYNPQTCIDLRREAKHPLLVGTGILVFLSFSRRVRNRHLLKQ